MRDAKFVFIGNRGFVLEEMLAKGLDVVRILAVKNSYLERALAAGDREFTVVGKKSEVVRILEETDFDYLVANGCPFILPISKLDDGHKVFLNVHPGPLPDLRGADPVPGALLTGHDSGATCHVMDDGIDTGRIVSRVVIENTGDLDAALLYQMSFLAEKQVFNLALERNFEVAFENAATPDCIYYTKKDDDLAIDLAEPTETILRRIQAFSNRSQGARFVHGGETYRVFRGREIANPFLVERIDGYAENEVVFNIERSLLVRHGGSFLWLDDVEGDLSRIRPGDVLGA